MTAYQTKDSGAREEFDSGMKRDTEADKPRFWLTQPLDVPYEEQMLTRFAALLGRGAEKYEARNWELATGEAELERGLSSAFRHFMQWLHGETDEDHAAAVWFNITLVERLRYHARIADELDQMQAVVEDRFDPEGWDEEYADDPIEGQYARVLAREAAGQQFSRSGRRLVWGEPAVSTLREQEAAWAVRAVQDSLDRDGGRA